MRQRPHLFGQLTSDTHIKPDTDHLQHTPVKVSRRTISCIFIGSRQTKLSSFSAEFKTITYIHSKKPE